MAAFAGTVHVVPCVIWEWMRDDGEYSPYDPMSSEAIEGAYAASCQQHQLKDYTISFADMTQTRLSTGESK